MHAVGASGEASSSTSLNTVTLTTLEVAVSSNAMSATEPRRHAANKAVRRAGGPQLGCEVHLLSSRQQTIGSRRSLRNDE